MPSPPCQGHQEASSPATNKAMAASSRLALGAAGARSCQTCLDEVGTDVLTRAPRAVELVGRGLHQADDACFARRVGPTAGIGRNRQRSTAGLGDRAARARYDLALASQSRSWVCHRVIA